MTLRTHRLPAVAFTALARGGGGMDAIHRLHAARDSSTRLSVHALLSLSRGARHPEAGLVERAYLALQDIDQVATEPVAALLSYPPVSAWAIETARQLRGDRAHRTHPGLLAAIAAVAAIRARIALQIEVPLPRHRRPRLVLPSLGWIRVPDGADRVLVRCAGGRADLVHAGMPFATVDQFDQRWHPIPGIRLGSGELRLTAQLDGATWGQATGTPINAALEIDDGDIDVPAWSGRLAEAWRLLAHYHRPLAEELATAVTVLAPLLSPPTGMISGTFRNAFGAVAMSLPGEPRLAALTLAHELQHTKLAALMDLFPLVSEDRGARYYAPWRDDPRPLDGLLHGAYAHLGVAGFWRRQRHCESGRPDERRAEIEFSRWTSATYDVVQVLQAQPGLTAVGRRLVGVMGEVLAGWRQEPVSTDAARVAHRLADAHLAKWRKNHSQPAGTGS